MEKNFLRSCPFLYFIYRENFFKLELTTLVDTHVATIVCHTLLKNALKLEMLPDMLINGVKKSSL